LELEGKTQPSQSVIHEALSDRYGWTPSQIREQRADDIEAYLSIISMKSQIEKLKMKKNGR